MKPEPARPSLWQLIESLGLSMPLTQHGVEAVLGTKLKSVHRDEHMLHLQGPGPQLWLDANVTRVDLVLDPNGEFGPNSGITLTLGGACLSRGLVTKLHSELKLVGSPRGRSLEDASIFAYNENWGQVAFGFKEVNPQCLAFVTLRRAD